MKEIFGKLFLQFAPFWRNYGLLSRPHHIRNKVKFNIVNARIVWQSIALVNKTHHKDKYGGIF
ncbi:hypothetical protein SAMN02745220_04381 [Desulfopila aestuarii DSM 18488]|uniref:Uncharacterized protein n=1 Tax=Desulfopila aestuarii DSM 18488 TaxID=1121416 RepID=A0A1M7YHJ7_9BACT|nr:hypothetical protein SAMN02745220_04381 [Desulfopila aestuarii DSM 18488]